jgi:hypothetical protein
MAAGRGGGGASRGFQPPRAGLCQRRPSLSKEGNFVAHLCRCALTRQWGQRRLSTCNCSHREPPPVHSLLIEPRAIPCPPFRLAQGARALRLRVRLGGE